MKNRAHVFSATIRLPEKVVGTEGHTRKTSLLYLQLSAFR
jgi:hypothetical protein